MTAYSAGSQASGAVNEKAIQSMKNVGYDLTSHRSKSLDDVPKVIYDFVITMGCGDACPAVKAKERQNWAISDPKDMKDQPFDEVREIIKKKVEALMNEIQV